MEPVLVRIPFSHFCRKAEWGLTQAGVPYEALDVGLAQMGNAARANPRQGTVPVLAVGQRVLMDSHDILVWADENRAPGAPPLYPSAIRLRVADWETWADEAIGPAVRREAYRALHERPGLAKHYDVPIYFRLPVMRAAYLRVLKHYKARRYEATDRAEVEAAMTRVANRLKESGTSYLFGSRPTAADVTTAALLEPILLCKGSGYAQHPEWRRIEEFIHLVKPHHTTRTQHRAIKERDWQTFDLIHSVVPQSEPVRTSFMGLDR